ncbi:MAG: FtsX-like permease family protein [Gammaproteobacteria bacterium]|nr:FtsX-like permease family protein [Gammaproteobacteria bacterium]
MFVNRILQILSVIRVSLGSLPERTGTALVATIGFAAVVLVFTGMLSIREGFEKVVQQNGSPDVAMAMRGGSTAELNSGVSLEASRIIGQEANVFHDDRGPVVSPEVLLVVDAPRRTTLSDSNVPFRGVTDRGFVIHDKVRIVEGRMYEEGKGEVIVGRQAAAQFAGLDVGRELRWSGFSWKVVGVFAANGGLEESEIWTDARTLQTAFDRGTYFQSVYIKLTGADTFQSFKDSVTTNPQLNVTVQRYDEYLHAQTEFLSAFVAIAGGVIALLMGLGAVFGAINAMYAAVSSRALEIATLRALGFGRLPVLISVMAEAMVLGIAGGVLGGIVAWIAFDGFQTSTLNWASFSQVAFQFAVTPSLLVQGTALALLLGLFGGLLPAVRAARLPIAEALRGH